MNRRWTPDLVEAGLVEGYRELRTSGALAARRGAVTDFWSRRRITGPDLIVASFRLLEKDHEPELSALTIWAKMKAGLDNQGITIPVFMERRRIASRQGFDAMRKRGAGRIADGLNAVDALGRVADSTDAPRGT